MPKTMDDVKKALEALENGSELFEAVTSTVSDLERKITAEKNKGISEVNKRNKEAENMRKFKKAWESLGFNPDESEIDEFASGISENMKQLTELTSGDGKGTKDLDITKIPAYQEMNKTVKKLTKQIETQSQELNSEREKAASLIKKTQASTMKSALLKHLGDKVYGADILADNLITSGRVKVDEADESKIVFVKGDDTLDFDAGIKTVLEERKDILKNSQSGGAGTGAGGKPPSTDGDKEKKHKEWVNDFNKNR